MKKLMIIAAAAAGMCLSVQAAGFTMPFTVTAVGTATKSTNLVAITKSVTNWVDLKGFYISVSNGCSATVSLFATVGSATNVYDSVTLTAPTNNYSLTLWMPRKAVWGSANPQVDNFPIVGTNCFLSIRQNVVTTNDYFIVPLIAD